MKIEINLPQNLSAEVQKTLLAQVYYLDERISNASISGSLLCMALSSDVSDKERIQKAALRLFDEILLSFKRADDSILDEYEGVGVYQKDPQGELTERRDFVEVAPGIANYQGELLKLMRSLDHKVRKFALKLGATEQEYPTTVPTESMIRNSYLSNFPQHAIFASYAQSRIETLKVLADRSKPHAGAVSVETDVLASPQQMLAPTVCYHCFEALKHRPVIKGNELYTAYARCHRHEYKTTHGLERLQTFSMRELIFFGDETFVNNTRDQVIEFSKQFLTTFGLRWRLVSANDPFFASESHKKRSYQSLLGLKQELQVYLPYKDSWLAVGSFNNHRDTLVRAYGLSFVDTSKTLFSGCVGYGYERMALGFFAQFGPHPSDWPSSTTALQGRD